MTPIRTGVGSGDSVELIAIGIASAICLLPGDCKYAKVDAAPSGVISTDYTRRGKNKSIFCPEDRTFLNSAKSEIKSASRHLVFLWRLLLVASVLVSGSHC